MKTQTISASEFKAKCLDIFDRLGTNEIDRLVITKRGKPVAILTPPESKEHAIRNIHGFMRGSVIVPDGFDLTAPVLDEPFGVEDGLLHG
jgi:antitoxin (DNA-binding transcriptional repressor) of toxin-antitoxin stability system